MAEEDMNTKGTTVETVSDVPKDTEGATPQNLTSNTHHGRKRVFDNSAEIDAKKRALSHVDGIDPTTGQRTQKPVVPTITTSSKPSTIEQQYLDSRKKPVIPTITTSDTPSTIEQQYLDSKNKASDQKTLNAPGMTRPEGYGTTEGVVTDDVEIPKLDYSQTEAMAKTLKDEEIQAALEQESVDIQNFKNAYSHLLAQGKDSGFINARNMASMRSAMLNRYNRTTAAEVLFNKNMLNITEKKELEDYNFDKEQYNEQANMHKGVIESLMSNNDLDGAIEYAESIGDEFGMFSYMKNPTWVESQRALQDKNVRALIDGEGGVIEQLTSIGLDAENDPARAERLMMGLIDENEKHLGGYAVEILGSIPDNDYLNYGIEDEAEWAIVQEFLDGKRDLSDPNVKEILTNSIMKSEQKRMREEQIRDNFGDLSDKYQSDPYLGPLYDAVLDEIVNEDGIISFDGQNISTYGLNIDGKNLENTVGVGHLFTDWDGNVYQEGDTRDQNQGSVVSGFEGTNFEGYTNEQMDDMYEAYNKEQSAQYRALTTPEQKQEFRQDLLTPANFKKKMVREVKANPDMNESELRQVMTSGQSFGEVTQGNVSDELSGMIGDTSFEVSERNAKEAAKLVEALENGTTITDSMINSLGDTEEEINNALIGLAENGHLISSDMNINSGYGFNMSQSGGEDVLWQEENSGSMFTGEGLNEILPKLDGNNQAIVMMDGQPVRVTARHSRINVSGNDDVPAIEWTVQYIGQDQDDAHVFLGEIKDVNNSSGRYKIDRPKRYAEEVLKNRSTKDVDSKYAEEKWTAGEVASDVAHTVNSEEALAADAIFGPGLGVGDTIRTYDAIKTIGGWLD